MNILLVTGPIISLRQPYNSGIETFIVSLANELTKNGHTVNVVAKDADADVLCNVIKLSKRSPSAADKTSLNQVEKERNQITQFGLLDVNKYDIIHYNLFIPELYKVAERFKKPAILTLHSPVDDPRTNVYRSFANSNDVTFVAVSERMKEQWSVALHKAVAIIHNGIDLEQWPLQPRAKNGYLLWSARINDEKNVTAAIALAKHMKRPLKVVGRIVDQAYFDQYVVPFLNDNIQYIEHTTQTELHKLAGGASVFLATAKWQEPFGLAALEMLASGLPVVGFQTALPPDLRHGGVSVAAPSTDWHDLIPLLDQVTAANPKMCRDFAANFSVQKMAQAYGQLYRSLANGHAPHSQPTKTSSH